MPPAGSVARWQEVNTALIAYIKYNEEMKPFAVVMLGV